MNLLGRISIAPWPNLILEAEFKVLSLCNVGRLREALQILLSNKVPLSSPTYSHLLQRCLDSNAKDEGKILHDQLLALGCPPNLHLGNKFIILLAKAGDLVSARKVFDGMPEKNVVSWTALISGYSQNGFLDETLDLFSLMHRGRNKANQFTYASVLRACTGTRCIKNGLQIQGCIEKSRFRQNLYVNSALVDFHLKCGVLEDAWSLFCRMEDRDVVLWNSMIGGHAVRGLADDSFRLFILMLKEGKIPDHFTFASTLKACGLVKDFLNADKMHSFIIKSGFANHYAVAGSLIDAYVKCKRMSNARLLYDSLPEQDIVSCTTLITGYSQDISYSRNALKLYCKINQTGMKIDDIILCSMLNVSANKASLDLGKQIHARAVKNQSSHDLALHNALVDMYAKSGELKDAHLAFDEMKSTNVISWTSLIAGYGKHGQGEDAVALFKKMEDNGVKPNDVTFLSLISACSHSGLTSQGMNFFYLMVNKYAIQPRSEHYSCVVDLLGRDGLINEAFNFVKKMNVKPNLSIWGSMLGACRIHDNRSIGEIVAGNLLKLYPHKSVNYIVLANIYAAANLWENAWRTRKLMEQKSCQKDPGCSFPYLPDVRKLQCRLSSCHRQHFVEDIMVLEKEHRLRCFGMALAFRRSMSRDTWRWLLGLSYIVAVAMIWIAASYIVQSVVDAGVSPFLVTYICNSLFLIYIPIVEIARFFEDSVKKSSHRIIDVQDPDLLGGNSLENLSLLHDINHNSEPSSLRNQSDKNNSSGIPSNFKDGEQSFVVENGLSGQLDLVLFKEDSSHHVDEKRHWARFRVAKISLLICPFWFFGQLTFNLSLKYTTVTSNTILSSASSLFTFFVSLAFLGEKFTWLKLVSVLLCMGGTIIVSLADSSTNANAVATNPVLGDIFALVSASLYAVYITMIRAKLPDENDGEVKASTAQFLGYLGLFNFLIFLPVVIVLDFIKLEPFHVLTWKQLGLIVGKGLLDNVVSDYLQVKATQLTSTTVATAGLSVQVPLAAIVDSITGHAPLLIEYIGAASIMVGFVGINIPSNAFSHSQETMQEQEAENVSMPTELVEFGPILGNLHA